jgi:hypothetical protein
MLLPPEIPSSWKLGPSTFASQLVPDDTLTVHEPPLQVKFCTTPSMASASNVIEVGLELRWELDLHVVPSGLELTARTGLVRS